MVDVVDAETQKILFSDFVSQQPIVTRNDKAYSESPLEERLPQARKILEEYKKTL